MYRGWGIRTPIDGFGDRCSAIELIPYINKNTCTFKTTYCITSELLFITWTTVGSSNLFELPTHSVAAVTSNPLRFFSVPFASQISCLPLKRSCMQTSILAFPSSMLLSSCFWSSPRPISDSQLHALPHFHLCPIYLVVFKGSYSFRWDISSWGGLHA